MLEFQLRAGGAEMVGGAWSQCGKRAVHRELVNHIATGGVGDQLTAGSERIGKPRHADRLVQGGRAAGNAARDFRVGGCAQRAITGGCIGGAAERAAMTWQTEQDWRDGIAVGGGTRGLV